MLVYVLLIVGFVLLIKGADFFVEGSSSLARKFHVPSLIIGMTIVAMGTSAPECAVSISASLAGSNGLAISNVIGSNLFNLLMVCGVCAVILPLRVKSTTLKKEFPFSVLVGLLLFLFGITGMKVGRVEGIIMLAVFVYFLYWMIASAKNKMKQNAQHAAEASAEDFELEVEVPEEKHPFSWPRCLIYMIGGVAAIVFGGQLVVNSAQDIASSLGLSDTLIGLTVCAIGTSLPELVTSIVAARKGEDDMALGNVIGSNIFNILLVLGLATTISPIAVTMDNLIDLIILAAVSVMIFLMAFSRQRLNRICGGVCVGVYVAYMAYICMR